MRYLYEEVAYLKGLAEGLDISNESKEGKILHKIIEVLDGFADAIVQLDEEQSELAEYIESIDEDLSDVEDDLYDEDEVDDEDEDFKFIDMECPNCSDLVEIDEELLYDDEIDIVCPNCQAIVLPADNENNDCIDCD